MIRGVVVAVLALMASATQAWALPDLEVSELRVNPFNAEVGEEIVIEMAIRNRGDMPVRSPGPTIVSTSVDLAIMRTAVTPFHEGAYVTGWGTTRDIPPGGVERNTIRIRVPEGGPANAGYICADVDRVNGVRESSETNNRRCVNFHARAAKANILIRGYTIGAVSGVSRRVRVTLENTGRAAATNFRLDAFALAPRRWPLVVTDCALTTRAGPVACGAIWVTLAPGERRTVDAWIMFPVDVASGSRQTIELYADGCHPPLDPGLPAFCRVDESNEADNARRIAIVAP